MLTSIAACVTTIEHCSLLQPSGIQYEPEQGRCIADAGVYVSPTIFQGMGKLLVQDPEQPWVAAHFERQTVRFDRVRRLVEQGVQLVSGSDARVSFNTFADYPSNLILTHEGQLCLRPLGGMLR
jgi:imidazolonepropionase-like amidohydrolase